MKKVFGSALKTPSRCCLPIVGSFADSHLLKAASGYANRFLATCSGMEFASLAALVKYPMTPKMQEAAAGAISGCVPP
jgi:hypothetical protein